MNFENIDVKDIGCFGFTSPKSKCWLAMLNKAKEYANVADKKMLEKSFSRNVETSYFRLCGISFVDLDTDLNYFASFVNGWKKWELEIEDGKAEVSIEDKKKFFATDEMKAATFIATLNGTGSAWKAGSATFGGYPAFTWTE